MTENNIHELPQPLESVSFKEMLNECNIVEGDYIQVCLHDSRAITGEFIGYRKDPFSWKDPFRKRKFRLWINAISKAVLAPIGIDEKFIVYTAILDEENWMDLLTVEEAGRKEWKIEVARATVRIGEFNKAAGSKLLTPQSNLILPRHIRRQQERKVKAILRKKDK